MFSIYKNGSIQINRGDSFTSALFINKGSLISPVRYDIQNTDTVVLYILRPNDNYNNCIIQKSYTTNSTKTKYGDLIISLTPEETSDLEYGKYYYSIKLYRNSSGISDVITIIPEKELFIMR